MPAEKLQSGRLDVVELTLFSSYLLIRLGQGPTHKAGALFAPLSALILVVFGFTPAKVDDVLNRGH